MLKNYFVLFIRNLKRQKLFSIINLVGLTVGITSTLVIYLYVQNDFSHDRFHQHADRIYRINQTNIWGDNDLQLARTGPGVANALKTELPEAEMITSIHPADNSLVSYIDESNHSVIHDQENIFAADSSFFKMFSFQVVKGNPETCLIQPQSLVVTESTARKYFGSEEPLGKILQIGVGENTQVFEVTGVVKDIADNSYINFEMLMSLSSFPRMKTNGLSWVWTQLETFILMEKGADIENTRMKLKPIPRKYLEGSMHDAMNMSFDEYIKSGKAWDIYLQPLTQIHLYSDNVVGNSNATGNLKIVYALVSTAIFIILLSCINFMNLSTAQFTRRIREASIRKILGLDRKELGLGYFFEAFAFCLVALVVAFAFTQTILPWFNQVTGKALEMNVVRDSGLIVMMFLLLFFMSMLSGSFPALFLSAFHPVDAMKGKLKTGREGKGFRNGLVVLQFAVSIVLTICTTLVFQQLNFFSAKSLGFDKENLLVIDHVERTDNGATLANAIADIPGVVGTSFCAALPLHMGSDWFKPRGYGGRDFTLFFAAADEHYLSTLGIELIVGRNFSAFDSADIDRVILNETAVKTLGWNMDESIIGKIIDYPNESTKFQVMGVVRDYHFTSLETRIEPMAIFHMKSKVWKQRKYVLARIAPQDSKGWESMFIALRKIWKQHAGDQPFKYEFVDKAFAAKLQTQRQFGKALQIMASLAILIACLGLLGMVIYTLEQRTKEIGIRKISGAGIWNILILISRGYTKLIIIAFAVGAPLSYWLIQQWLQDFENRIIPSVWVFVLTGLGTLLFSFLITSYHSVTAALANPIDVLKDE
jgi:putative ABC transport system permease protein